MSCKKCQEVKTPCFQAECGCTYKVDTDCITYSGEDLTCSSIPSTTNLSEVLEGLDNYICDVKDLIGSLQISNVGSGAESFKGINVTGVREFRTLVSTEPNLTITEGTNTIDFDIAESSVSNRGLIEIATQTEVNTGTDSVRAITPATLNQKTATETRRGVIEIATQAEADAGTDNTRAITPLRMVNYVDQVIGSIPGAPNATTTQRGIAELATNAETQTGTDTERIVTPAGLNSRTSTESRTGIIAIATQAEVNAGTNNTKAVTPLKLDVVVDNTVTNLQNYVNNYVSNPGNLPNATTTSRGIAELATSAEVVAGTDGERIVTPAGLAALTSTQSRRGLVELATQAESNALSDTTRAVSPGTIPVASTTQRGVAEIATQTEVNLGSDTTKYVTPATLESKLQAYTPSLPLWGSTGTIDVGSNQTGLIAGSQGIFSSVIATRLGDHETSLNIQLSESISGRKISTNVVTNSSNIYNQTGVTVVTRVVNNTQIIVGLRQTLDEVQAIKVEIMAFTHAFT